ncbi:MAG: MgtC/SapB family protein [Clostridia bacterium]|nr:MgtC/SapB family protein [Clostridia bacterium]
MKAIMEILVGLNVWSVSARLLLSVLLGGFIGMERGSHGRAAGLRTHILVCLGAAMATMVGLYSVSVLGFPSDPLRVGAQVVSGIGFLGVGTIIIRNREVTGLTTAAGLWATACIGLAVGIGFYFAALLAFVAVILTITVFTRFEHNTRDKNNFSFYVEVSDPQCLKELYEKLAPYMLDITVIPPRSGIAAHVGLDCRATTRANYERMFALAQSREEVLIALPAGR